MNNKQRKTLVVIVCAITLFPLILILLESILDGYTNNTLDKLLSDDDDR